MSFWKWSKTASANQSSDATVNLQEGQSARSINDSIRSAMAALAKWRDDTSGALEASGSASAFLLSTNQGFTAPIAPGTRVVCTFPVDCAANAALSVDGSGALQIVTAPGTNVTAGSIKAGVPTALTLISGQWVIHGNGGNSGGVGSSFTVATGSVI